MTTGGGLVFSGGTNDRMFRAFDASTGKGAVGVSDQLRYLCAGFFVRDRRQAVRRGAFGMGPGRASLMQTRIDAVSPGSFPEGT